MNSPDLGMLMLCLAKLQLRGNTQVSLILQHFEELVVNGLRAAFQSQNYVYSVDE